jgi:Co/Zn/Cd efflux system component
VRDLHLWRLGPGHLGAIVSIGARSERDEAYFRERLARFEGLSHLTIEIVHPRELTAAA